LSGTARKAGSAFRVRRARNGLWGADRTLARNVSFERIDCLVRSDADDRSGSSAAE
jgi:hypothetical protein